jgi:hypothetical protein
MLGISNEEKKKNPMYVQFDATEKSPAYRVLKKTSSAMMRAGRRDDIFLASREHVSLWHARSQVDTF